MGSQAYNIILHSNISSSNITHTIVIMWSLIVINIALVAALPTELPSEDVIDERIVNREDGRADTAITGSLVNDVKQINVLLNIPNNCNAENIYNDMIKQINNCKTGSDRGHPNLTSGCLLKIDFTMLNSECRNSKLTFPTEVRIPGIQVQPAMDHIARNHPILNLAKPKIRMSPFLMNKNHKHHIKTIFL